MNIPSLLTTPLRTDPATYIASAGAPESTPRVRPDAGTVALAENVTLYTSKDRKHDNPLTMSGKSGDYVRFVDTKDKEYKYTPTDKPTVFLDAKGRNVYVVDSKEHREAVAALRDRADNQGRILRDMPLPQYVARAAALGAIAGGTIGGTAAGIPGAVGGAVAGAAVIGGPAAAIANLMLHKDQFILRDKLAVLQDTGVMRRAETLRDAVVHSTNGKGAAFYECLFSTSDDTVALAEQEASRRLDALVEQEGKAAAQPAA
ncbi:hypothetical protein WKR88_25665 [Trinickia caryophylli]|uniref:Uncharacterized protein n=1 Tax=Trinickia caryophylli TaxID=28094 RepID=A0A1X7H7X7_TRICW|nr:hypothetical protein [Trinickia caryophylli]TRX19154.1 hypothetical protein FNF07_13550 [Trinickia caryophylli]WQE13549.1 hypothetical protein U0034_09380 [Trinickia caryophylli]GLU33917.1 hypothetical protein Busp01_37590 [Trinickia caryophylli]SMF80415.1 hypothetical protein SAMN06295900_12248 [Trinickia caryophylli]